MRLARSFLVVPVVLAACVASRSSREHGSASPGDDAAKQQECAAIIAKLDVLDEAFSRLAEGPDIGLESLGSKFEQLSAEVGALSITTPELQAPARTIAADAAAFARTFAAAAPDIKATQEVMDRLIAWQTNVDQAFTQFEAVCDSGPEDDCERIRAQLQQIPDGEGDDFYLYADELEAFIATTRALPIADASVKASLDALLEAIGEAVDPYRRLPELFAALAKIEPESEAVLKTGKEIRALCGAAN